MYNHYHINRLHNRLRNHLFNKFRIGDSDSNAHVEKDYRAHTTEMSSPSRNQKKNLADSDIRQTLQKPG